MCGINGIALSTRSNRTLDVGLLEAMRDTIRHRGPDDHGIFVDGPIGLGHRRLSIVDVAAGQQPMTNEDGSLKIIFNGEIYNHADYRNELEARGHRYRTHCDTETILHLYEEHGAGAVEHLRGMFAFAIWDKIKKELFIARDRLGVKPLYYVYTSDGSLYFASEIKALLTAEAVKAELNYEVLPDYLANHAPSGEATMFCGIKRLLPGHTLLWRDGRIEIKKYWDVSFAGGGSKGGGSSKEPEARSDKDYIQEWTELFHESVRLRLMADVPLGMFLSGGIDSSAIAAVMSGMVTEPIKTFSVAFAEREANELEYARVVSQAFNTDHHEVVVSPAEFFRELPNLVWHEDEPLAHPSSVALYFVSRLAARHVKVVLTGEGSDEMLAGYERYRKTIYNLKFGRTFHGATNEPVRVALRSVLNGLPLKSQLKNKLRRTFLYLTPDIESIYFDNFAVFSRAAQTALLSSQTKQLLNTNGVLDPYREITQHLEHTDAATLLNRLLYADTKTYLHELLMKQDQMSMAASIESRVPFLDHKLVEYTAKLPERMKLRGWTTKFVLRESMKGVLPEQILRRPKMGFPVPVGNWFRGQYRHIVDEYVLGARTASRGLFEPEAVRRIVEEHMSNKSNHTERLWSLVNLEMWMRRFIDNEEPTSQIRNEVETEDVDSAVPALA